MDTLKAPPHKQHFEIQGFDAKDPPANKFRVLLDFERGDASLSETADKLSARTASDVLKSLVAYREHLPYLIEASERLERQYATQQGRRDIIDEIATKLNITRRQVNRIMKNTAVISPMPYKQMLRVDTHLEAKEKWLIRFRCALSVIAGYETMDAAASVAGVSGRQIYRWVTKLLATQEIALKDLKQMTLGQRKKISDLIEADQEQHYEHDTH